MNAIEEKKSAAKLERLPQVIGRVGLSRSEWYRQIQLGNAPAPVPLGERARAWVSSEVDAFINARIAARDQRRAA